MAKKPIKVTCISDKLIHVDYEKDSNGNITGARRIKKGDEFTVGAIPKHWEGLVVPTTVVKAKKKAEKGDDENDTGSEDKKVAVTGQEPAPQSDEEKAKAALEAARADYKELVGNPAHFSWNVEQIEANMAEFKKKQSAAK